MTAQLGSYCLTLSVLSAAAGMLACVAAVRFDNTRLLALARGSVGAICLFLTLASIALLSALLDDAFQFKYIAGYSEISLPTGYKIAAFWAGQEGSLLLWGWMLGVMSLIAVLIHRDEGNLCGQAAMNATLLFVVGFFALLMIFAANPFALTAEVPADGRGLNPMLQDPGMIAHPPLLFLGYAGFTIPFAMMLGAMAGDPASNQWIAATRRWTLIAWLFLSIGILLGAQWAYVELGWGGYWAWDPVENASLLPWLTGTAVIHSLMVQVRRGMFKRWNVCLIAATFILCIFGTYLTRSGVVGSVHSFGKSMVGNFFLGFLMLTITMAVAVIGWRWKKLAPNHTLQLIVSREGAFLAGNVLLVVITVTTLIGTIFPLISGLFMDEPVTVKESFYNTVVVPMGLILLGLMAMGPVLKAGQDAAEKMGRVIVAPTVAGVIAVAVAVALGLHNIWALGCVFVTVAAMYSLIADFVATVRGRMANTGEHPCAAAVRLFDSDHRRYGGQLTHVGMILLAIGVTGSSLYGVNQTLQLQPGESAPVGRHTLTFVSLSEVTQVNYVAVEATVTLTDPAGRTTLLHPQRRFYHKFKDMPNSEVALQSSLREDLYLTLAGWEQGGKVVAIQAVINPLVCWIWIGGIVLTVGGIVCILPRLLPHSRRVAESTASVLPAAT